MRQRRGGNALRKIWLVAVLAVAVSLVSCSAKSVVYRADGILTAHYLDVGQSDCTFVEVGGEYTLMIDATDSEHADDVVRYVRSLGYASVDMLVLTHPHFDHIGGAPDIMDALDVSAVYMTKYEGTGHEYEQLVRCIEENSIETRIAERGAAFTLGGLSGEFLTPTGKLYEDENDMSAVLRLTYGEQNFLFMGDAGAPVEAELLDRGALVSASVVKAGHHGAASASTQEFVLETGAEYVVFSCGLDNDYAHPSPYTVFRWESAGAKTYRTDRDSTVIACTDGTGLLCASISEAETWQGFSDITEDIQAHTMRTPRKCLYVLNCESHLIHRQSCPYWKDLPSSAYERSSAELERLYAEGYKECKYCFN